MASKPKTSVVVWDNAPALYTPNQNFQPTTGSNPARYLVDPGAVKAPGKHSAGALRHARPYLVSGNVIFVFPVGVEGFSEQAQATLGLHRYVGGNVVDANTIMREESRITLNGTFPGGTAQDAKVNCRNILRSKPPTPGLILYAPGVWEQEQYVVPESWEFTHDQGDRTHSIDYTITLVRVGTGKAVADPHGIPAATSPTTTRKGSSSPAKTFTVRSGVQTFQQIAKAVYGDSKQWQKLMVLNAKLIGKFGTTYGLYALPTYRWAVGTKVKY